MGAGQIAQGLDKPAGPAVLTAAHAVQSSNAFALGGFYDSDPALAEAAERKWKCGPTSRRRLEWLRHGWDVIYIATPSERHLDDLKDALAVNPKAIWIEKPLAAGRRQGVPLLQKALTAGIPVVVNYQRRWHSGTNRVKELLQAGTLGQPIAATFVYSGGIGRNGVHMLDLFRLWWGGGWKAKRLHRRPGVTHLGLTRSAQTVECTFIDLADEDYYAFEMNLYCSKGKIAVMGRPERLSVSHVRKDKLYPSFDVLTATAEFNIDGEPLLSRALEIIAGFIDDRSCARAHLQMEIENETFISSVLDALNPVEETVSHGKVSALRR